MVAWIVSGVWIMLCCVLVIAGLCIVIACYLVGLRAFPDLLGLTLLYSLRWVRWVCGIDVLFCCGWLLLCVGLCFVVMVSCLRKLLVVGWIW